MVLQLTMRNIGKLIGLLGNLRNQKWFKKLLGTQDNLEEH